MQIVIGKVCCALFFVWGILHCSLAKANAIDSIHHLLKKEQVAEKRVLHRTALSQAYLDAKEYKRCIVESRKALTHQKYLSDSLKCFLYQRIAFSFQSVEELDSSLFYLDKAEPCCLKSKETFILSNNYLSKGTIWFSLRNLEYAAEYFQKSRDSFLSIDQNVWAAKASINLATTYSQQEKPLEQLATLRDAHKIIQSADDPRALMILKAQMAAVFSHAGVKDSSMTYYTEAFRMAQKSKDSTSMAIYYGNISQVHTNAEQFVQAKSYARKAIGINKKINRAAGLAYSYFALGRIYDRTENYDSSLTYYRIALKQAIKSNIALQSSIYLNSAIVLMSMERNDSALWYLQQSKKIEERQKKSNSLALIYTYLARLSMKEPSLLEAENYLDSAEENALYFNIHRKVRSVYEAKSDLELLKGNPEKALHYYKLFQTYEDSIFARDQLLNIQFLSALHEKERKDASIKELKRKEQIGLLELENVKQQRWSLVAVSVLLLLIGLVLIRSYLRKRRDHRLLADSNATVVEKNKQLATLNKEIYHRAKNNLQTISSLLSLQRFDVKDEGTRKLINENTNRVNAMAIINKRLFSENQLEQMDLQSFLPELVQDVSFSYGVDPSIFTIDYGTQEVFFDADRAVPMSLIANELISNALKYAVPNNPEPKINIELATKQNQLNLSIRDNGPGFKEGFNIENNDSFGWEMIQMMVEQLHGNIEARNNDGAQVVVSLSINNSSE